jgi:hypothetical protein
MSPVVTVSVAAAAVAVAMAQHCYSVASIVGCLALSLQRHAAITAAQNTINCHAYAVAALSSSSSSSAISINSKVSSGKQQLHLLC